MKHRVLDLLQSVPDGGQLRIANIKKVVTKPVDGNFDSIRCQQYCALKDCPVKTAKITPQDCRECYGQEIVEGELVSEQGKKFPITGGIPRLLSDNTADFLRKNKESFSLEWKYFRFGERNWGQTIEFRKSLFLKALGEDPKTLRGKTIFDAGCGSGLLSITMAESFGMEVVGLDLSTGIEQAYAKNTNPNVHFIQGSVLEPPVRENSVDYVYCAGVLVALPSTKTGFNALHKCVKPGGRYFIWLYHPMERHRQTGDYTREYVWDWIRRNITSRLPIRLQELCYLGLLAPYFLKRVLLNPFRNAKENRTWQEKMQCFIDGLSPIYMNRHDEDEAAKWFKESGFKDVTVTYNEQYGFGIRGERVAKP